MIKVIEDNTKMILSITNLATLDTLTAVKDEVSKVSDLVRKAE